MRQGPLSLLFFFLLSTVAGAIGSLATFRSVATWYPTIEKPAWTPPNAIFGPVWSVLYVLMAIAAWRMWRTLNGSPARGVLRLHIAQLVLNTLWSVLFFGLHRPDLALVDIVGLLVLLVMAQVKFARVDRTAGVLWAPYLAWVSFAAVLNASIWWLNR